MTTADACQSVFGLGDGDVAFRDISGGEQSLCFLKFGLSFGEASARGRQRMP